MKDKIGEFSDYDDLGDFDQNDNFNQNTDFSSTDPNMYQFNLDDIFPDDILPDEDMSPWYEQDEAKLSEAEDKISEARKSYEKVDSQIINFITNFVDNQDKTIKQKHFLKKIFFWIIMGVFVIASCTPLIVVLKVDSKDTISFVAGIIASLAQTLASIIKLPKIVAEYLFNKEEDVSTIKIVELMQAYSEKVHSYDKN